MGLYLGITGLIFVFVIVIYKINIQNDIFSFFFVNITFQIIFTVVYLIYSIFCSSVIYTSEIKYMEISPQEGIYFKNLDGNNYLINVEGKDTLVQNTEVNREIEVPQIKIEIRYRKSSKWYWLLREEKEFYWVLEIPSKFYDRQREYRVENF